MLPKIEFRCPQELIDAAERCAADKGMSLAEYARTVLSAATGTPVEVKRGFQAFSPDELEQAAKKALATRRKRAKKRKSRKKSAS